MENSSLGAELSWQKNDALTCWAGQNQRRLLMDHLSPASLTVGNIDQQDLFYGNCQIVFLEPEQATQGMESCQSHIIMVSRELYFEMTR